MIIGLFINSCILITFISISYIFTKNTDTPLIISFISKIFIGIGSGLLGVVLMLFSVPITPNVMVDFRYLAILLCALYRGKIAPIIASIIIGVFRVSYFGVTNTSVTALIDALLIGIGFSIICATKVSRKIQWIYCIIYLIMVTSISVITLSKDTIVLFNVLIIYPVAIIIVSYLVFKYTEYLSRSNKLNNKFKSEATIDFLTGLNNARQFKKDFENFSQQTSIKSENLSLLYLDIDYFKRVNDTYGHNSGDIILRNLSSILRDTCRSFDIISRNGGEEFSVILLDCPASHAIKIAERIRSNVEANKFYITEKVNICITISIGVTTYPSMTDNIDNLIINADTALYEAKKTGRNKVCTYGLNKQIIN